MRGGAHCGQLKTQNGHAALEAFDVTILVSEYDSADRERHWEWCLTLPPGNRYVETASHHAGHQN